MGHGSRSAVTHATNPDRLIVFSTSTALLSNEETGHGYDRFEAYATLNHDGDIQIAAAASKQK